MFNVEIDGTVQVGDIEESRVVMSKLSEDELVLLN